MARGPAHTRTVRPARPRPLRSHRSRLHARCARERPRCRREPRCAGRSGTLRRGDLGTRAIAYAAHHPERVSHLVLSCASVRPGEVIGPKIEALLHLVERDWDLFTETAAHLLRGWSAGDSARRLASFLRAAASPEAVCALARAAGETDVTDLLPRVRAPTLVLHRRGLTWIPIDRAVELASHIPGARLVLLEGDSMAPWAGDMRAVTRVVDEFLGTGLGEDEPADRAAVPTDAFFQEGEYWTLAFAGRTCRLQDAKGLHHIAYLLGHPGEPVAVGELLAALDGLPAPSSSGPRRGAREAFPDAGRVLDAHARRAYRQRLTDLRAELDEAERFHDTGRATALQIEIGFIERELAAAVGLGGRNRCSAAGSERARLTVTKRIRDALERIRRHHPELGHHLARTLRTGLLCVYAPDPDRPVRWSL